MQFQCEIWRIGAVLINIIIIATFCMHFLPFSNSTYQRSHAMRFFGLSLSISLSPVYLFSGGFRNEWPQSACIFFPLYDLFGIRSNEKFREI